MKSDNCQLAEDSFAWPPARSPCYEDSPAFFCCCCCFHAYTVTVKLLWYLKIFGERFILVTRETAIWMLLSHSEEECLLICVISWLPQTQKTICMCCNVCPACGSHSSVHQFHRSNTLIESSETGFQ